MSPRVFSHPPALSKDLGCFGWSAFITQSYLQYNLENLPTLHPCCSSEYRMSYNTKSLSNSHPNPPPTVKMSSSRSSHRHHRCKSQCGSAHSSSPFDLEGMQFDLGESGGRRASRSGPLPSTPRTSWGASPMPHRRRGCMGIYMDELDGLGMGSGVRGLRAGGAWYSTILSYLTCGVRTASSPER